MAERIMSDLKMLEHEIGKLPVHSEKWAFLKGCALEKWMCAIMIERDFRNEPMFAILRYWEGIAEHDCGNDIYSEKCLKCDLREILGMENERRQRN